MSDESVETAATPAPPKKPRQGRSPAFPFISLRKALERAEAFRIAEGGRPKHYSPRAAIAAAWEMGEKTGPTKQTIAALGHYGLFEFEGSGDNRKARLTETALRILLDKQPDSSDRDVLIRAAALTPHFHAELWNKWQSNLPSDMTLQTYLILERGFSESGAKDLIVEYKDTLAFAKIGQPDSVPPEGSGSGDGDDRASEPDNECPSPPANDLPPGQNQRSKVKIMTGERELTTGLLSRDASFRLIVSGRIGAKEIDRLIKKLQLDREILAEMSDDEPKSEDDVKV